MQTKIKRPLIQFLTRDLESLILERYDDWQGLAEILVELLFRKRSAAIELRSEVVDRLIELLSEGGPWPDTNAPIGKGAIDDPEIWPQKGLLAFLGYRVGQDGVTESERREILDFVYKNHVPNVNSVEYMTEWDSPQTWSRLSKMAESIAAFARNAKRKQLSSLSVAIEEWEEDLEYLRVKYYVGRYDFVWPSTTSL